MFVNTKVLGVKVPFHVNFEEVNLRFYVKRFENNAWKRGVVFIKEIVPKAAITFVANTLYKEHYQTLKMKHKWEDTATGKLVEYHWKRNSNWQSFSVKADLKSHYIVKQNLLQSIFGATQNIVTPKLTNTRLHTQNGINTR